MKPPAIPGLKLELRLAFELAVSFFFKIRGEICYHLCNLRIILHNPDDSHCATHELYFWLRPCSRYVCVSVFKSMS